MRYPYNEETHADLNWEYPNVVEGNKVYVLPTVIVNHAVVEIFLTKRSSVVVESQHPPIRHGKHCGSRVHLGCDYGKPHYNPKFIWNGKEWLLDTYGTFCFGEIEINEVKELTQEQLAYLRSIV